MLMLLELIFMMSLMDQVASMKHKLGSKHKLQSLSKDKIDANSFSTVSQFEGQIQGWGKFFIFDPRQFTVSPGSLRFFQNPVFIDQQLRSTDRSVDQYGPINIPSQNDFYFVLMGQNFYVLSSRRDQMSSTIKHLDTTSITPQYQTNGRTMGGVLDIGKVDEGYCIEISTSIDQTSEIWLLCFDQLEAHQKWLSNFRLVGNNSLSKEYKGNDLAAPQATVYGQFGDLKELTSNSSGEYSAVGPNGHPLQTFNKKDPQDGEWLIINDWSSCTVKCGGGTQTLQRQCLPPKNGGKNCDGNEILQRTCNTDACPESITVESTSYSKTLPVAMKTRQFSQRPQIYERCIVKEGDLDLEQSQLTQFKFKPRLPARVIMNNQTISIFESTNYKQVLDTIRLKDVYVQIQEASECFELSAMNSQTIHTLCVMSQDSRSHEKVIKDWVNEIKFFQSSCYQPLPIKQDAGIQEVIRLKEKSIQDSIMEEKFSDTIANSQDTGDDQSNVTDIAMQAIAKEMTYENFQEKEEKKRASMSIHHQELQVEQVKEKMECLARTERETELKDSQEIQQVAKKTKIIDLKDKITGIIRVMRAKQNLKLRQLQQLAEVESSTKQDEASQLKIKFAAQVLQSYHMGDKNKCSPHKNQEYIKNFCQEVFSSDPQQNISCQNKDSFCFICCQYEFGASIVQKRKECIDQCGDKMQLNASGTWVPTEQYQKELDTQKNGKTQQDGSTDGSKDNSQDDSKDKSQNGNQDNSKGDSNNNAGSNSDQVNNDSQDNTQGKDQS